MSRHSKCMNGISCTGPGCTVRRRYVDASAPRVRTTPTKAERKLEYRQAVYANHGRNPNAGLNPSNSSGRGHDMHKPGSQNVRNN